MQRVAGGTVQQKVVDEWLTEGFVTIRGYQGNCKLNNSVAPMKGIVEILLLQQQEDHSPVVLTLPSV